MFLAVAGCGAGLAALTLALRIGSRKALSGGHVFWQDDVSLLDGSLFDLASIAGHRQLTDVYLLGLAHKRRGRLVTFDRTIPLRAVRSATAAALEVVAPSK